MHFVDYYETLGVARDAALPEIKKAFRRLARKYHPDVSKETDAEQRMREVNEAYAVLSDPGKRAAYDQLGQGQHAEQDFRPPPGWNAGFEFSEHDGAAAPAGEHSEFFSSLFGRRGDGHAPHRRTARGGPERGEDHHARVLIDIEDALTGAVSTVTLRTPHIDQQGRVAVDSRTLKVNIPRGILEGQVVRLAGQGGPGYANGPAGDLHLEVLFKPNPRLRVEGRNLHRVLPIAPWEAALGASVLLPLPGGAINLRVPAGSQSGRLLRLRGKGLPCDPPGDLLLELRVVLPPADSEKAKAIYQSMAETLAFDPRAGD